MAGVVLEADAGSTLKPGRYWEGAEGTEATEGSECCGASCVAVDWLVPCNVSLPVPYLLPPHTNPPPSACLHPNSGDRVFGLLTNCIGGYASKIVVPEAALARIPDHWSFEQAAATPLAALTAWQVGRRRVHRVYLCACIRQARALLPCTGLDSSRRRMPAHGPGTPPLPCHLPVWN